MSYAIRIVDAAKRELKALRVHDSMRILDAIEVQLTDRPSSQTRNKKRIDVVPSFEHLRPVWELRVGEFRVFYSVDETAMAVDIWAVRHKGRRMTGEVI